MAAVISEDGYALTAAHVLDDLTPQGTIQTPDATRRHHLILTRINSEKNSRTKTDVVLSYIPFPIPRPLGKRDSRLMRISQARVIHRFAGRDLALIKVPASKAPYFKIGKPGPEGDWVFSSGNGLASAPFPSSGKIIRVNKKNTRFLIRMPAAFGDSGGPIFNRKGELVGVFAEGTTIGVKDAPGLRFLQNTQAEIPDRMLLERLIAADRKSLR